MCGSHKGVRQGWPGCTGRASALTTRPPALLLGPTVRVNGSGARQCQTHPTAHSNRNLMWRTAKAGAEPPASADSQLQAPALVAAVAAVVLLTAQPVHLGRGLPPAVVLPPADQKPRLQARQLAPP